MASRSGALELEEAVDFPDWVMLDRMGHTSCHDDHAAAHEPMDLAPCNTFQTSSGHSCYSSFALAAPPKVSYITLHWPAELPADKPVFPNLPARPYVLAADNNLILISIAVNYRPSDLFVYTASPPTSSPPSALRLPVPDEPAEDSFLLPSSVIGILRLAAAADQDRGYIVAELDVSAKEKWVSPRRRTQDNSSSGSSTKFARLCVFSSATGNWRIITKRAPRQSNGDHQFPFPARWSTNDVFPFDGRFLCWVDYFKGLLISDFSKITSPALHFVPFPGKQYADDDNIRERGFGGMLRSVSVSQGMIRFVHIDNDWHDKDEFNRCSDCSERKRRKLGTKITIWTLKNTMDGDGSLCRFGWEVHRVINLECLWAQVSYQNQGMPRRIPEFPVIAADDPDVLCCVLREEEDRRSKEWMIMVDMKYAYLRSCTPCVNEKPKSVNCFRNVPLLPCVMSKHLKKPAGN